MSEKMTYEELERRNRELVDEKNELEKKLEYNSGMDIQSYGDLKSRCNMLSSALLYACTLVVLLWVFFLNLLTPHQPWFYLLVPFTTLPLAFLLRFLLSMAGLGTSRKITIWKENFRLSTVICAVVSIIFAVVFFLNPDLIFEIVR